MSRQCHCREPREASAERGLDGRLLSGLLDSQGYSATSFRDAFSKNKRAKKVGNPLENEMMQMQANMQMFMTAEMMGQITRMAAGDLPPQPGMHPGWSQQVQQVRRCNSRAVRP